MRPRYAASARKSQLNPLLRLRICRVGQDPGIRPIGLLFGVDDHLGIREDRVSRAIHQSTDMIRMQVGHQDRVNVLRFHADVRQVPREQAELGSEYGPAPAVDEYEAVRQVQEKRVHCQQRRHGPI
jgi:hypothetical protein